MKLYLAAPWINKPEALIAQQKFKAAGHEVTSHWITRDATELQEPLFGNPANDDYLQSEAIEDIEDIVQAEVFVILNLSKSEGKATEFGFAYALGIPTILVGPRDTNIFYYLPNVFRADTVEAVIEGLSDVSTKQAEAEQQAAGPVESVQ